MQRHILNDICCPASSQGLSGDGRLELNQSQVAVVYAPTDIDEIVEGVLRCKRCGAEYPVLGGLPILVAQPWLYLRDRYNLVLSLTAETGVAVSRPMIALLEAHHHASLSKAFIHRTTFSFLKSLGYAPCYAIAGMRLGELQRAAAARGVSRQAFNMQASSMGYWPRTIYERRLS